MVRFKVLRENANEVLTIVDMLALKKFALILGWDRWSGLTRGSGAIAKELATVLRYFSNA